MKDVKRVVSFSIKGHEYQINFPTVGQFIDLEASKQKLSRSEYTQMLLSGTIMSDLALDLIDAVAIMSVMCPSFVEDLKVNRLTDLSLDDASELVDQYRSTIRPWVDGWMSLFAKPEVKANKEKTESVKSDEQADQTK